MNRDTITRYQYMFIIVGTMIGIGIGFLGSSGAAVAHQDSWITTLISGIYPIIIVITAYIIDKKANHDDFWIILKKVYGKLIGFIILLIFLMYFLTIMSSVVAGFSNNLTQTISSFLSPYRIIIPCLLVSTVITMSGLNTVGRIAEFYFYLTVVFILPLLFLIPEGTILNIQPVFHSPEEIPRGMLENLTQYSLVEISFIIISKISNRKHVLRAGIIACTITTVIYTFVSFVVIFYLGWELASRIDFPLFYMIGTISFPIFSNLTSIFIFFWGLIVLKTIVCCNYMVSYCISSFSGLSDKISAVISSCIILVYSYFMISEHNRLDIVDSYLKYFILFSLVFGIMTAILVQVRYRSKKNEKI
ncbi:GerAB/ArcD/ProY family transporter [Vallitalea guaymasensis]|uniref:GerAB/ArcD/ProY family transporter n=1 Tax=Vallitalea guaymasensis TaxID=1185412 RepID=UPI000DE55636|nr:endospore germination permease [Vallitalea guaymasensis]